MRTLLRARLDTEAGNEVIRSGGMPKVMEHAMEQLHPEAAYFAADEGDRCAYLVFDLKEPSDIPVLVEPLFEDLKAKIELTPVMNLEDVTNGLQKLAQS